jgi:hypothetical protein
VKPPQRLAELLDFGLGDVFLVLGFGELLGNVVEVAENALKGFADAFDFGLSLQNP